MPFGYVDWKKNCSTSRSSCCGWRIRNPNRRSSGNRLRAGAARLNTAPSFHRNSCDRLRRWFRACSGRNRSYIPGSRFACKWHHFHSPKPMYGFRSPGKSKNHSIEKNAKRYNAFLQSLCKSDEFKSTPFEAYKTVCFLAHLSRIEMSAFIKRFNRAKWISRLKINRIVGSFRRENGDYMIFFIAAKNECGGGRHEDLLSCVENPKTIEKVFQVIIYWESITTYRVKMILSDT